MAAKRLSQRKLVDDIQPVMGATMIIWSRLVCEQTHRPRSERRPVGRAEFKQLVERLRRSLDELRVKLT